MRCFKLLLLGGIVLALAVPASAITVTMNLRNFDQGTLYAVNDATYTGVGTLDGLNQTSPVGGLTYLGQSDTWGIIRLENIQTSGGDYLYQGSPNREITGIFWGAVDNYLDQTTDAGGLIIQEIHANGLQMALFLDTTPEWSSVAQSTGPAGWTPDYGLDGAPGDVGVDDDGVNGTDDAGEYMYPGSDDGGPTYTGITDGTLIWTMVSTGGLNEDFPTDDFIAEFNQNQAASTFNSAGGLLFEMGTVDGWGTGPLNYQLDTDTIPAWNAAGTAQDKLVDLTVSFDGTSNDSGAWLLRTSDPMEGDLVPEPVTMAGLMLGIGSLVGYARRRR